MVKNPSIRNSIHIFQPVFFSFQQKSCKLCLLAIFHRIQQKGKYLIKCLFQSSLCIPLQIVVCELSTITRELILLTTFIRCFCCTSPLSPNIQLQLFLLRYCYDSIRVQQLMSQKIQNLSSNHRRFLPGISNEAHPSLCCPGQTRLFFDGDVLLTHQSRSTLNLTRKDEKKTERKNSTCIFLLFIQ